MPVVGTKALEEVKLQAEIIKASRLNEEIHFIEVTNRLFMSMLRMIKIHTVITSIRITEMLSSPPAELAASINRSQAACGELACMTI